MSVNSVAQPIIIAQVTDLLSSVVLVVALVGRWTRDRKVSRSTPGQGAIKSTRSTQPSIPLG